MAAPQRGDPKTRSEFHALDSRYAIEHLGKPSLHTAEHGLSQPGREACDGALYNPADAVQIFLCLDNARLHLFAFPGIQRWKGR